MNLLVFWLLFGFIIVNSWGLTFHGYDIDELYGTNMEPLDTACEMFGHTYFLKDVWQDPHRCILYQCRLMAVYLLRNRFFHMPYEIDCANVSSAIDPTCVKIGGKLGEQFQPYPICCPIVLCYRNDIVELHWTDMPDEIVYEPDYELFQRDYDLYIRDLIGTMLGVPQLTQMLQSNREEENKTTTTEVNSTVNKQ